MLVIVEQVHKDALRCSAILFQTATSHHIQQLYIPVGGLSLWSFTAVSSADMYCGNRCKQIMLRHKSTSKQLNVNTASDPLGFLSDCSENTQIRPLATHMHTHTHTLALNQEEPAGHIV